MSRTARTGSLGELLPLAAVEPDGLLVTTAGRYVRLIQCQRVPNTITADESRLRMLERAFRELCRAIPDRQSLVIYAQTDPIPIRDALAEDRARVQVACEQDTAAGNGELAATRRRFLAGLTQTVFAAAGSEQPAVAARWWVAVPYQPAAPETPARAVSARGDACPGEDRLGSAPRRGGREHAADRADPGRARRRRDRDLPPRRRANARAAVGARSPRRRNPP